MKSESNTPHIPEQTLQAKITQPQDSVVVSRDAHLSAVDVRFFTCESIAAALSQWQAVLPLASGDGKRFAGRSIRQAAVLVGLVQRGSEVNLVLTQRASHLRDHAGQIAFPGGAQDAADEDAWHTAQREAFEEVGLAQNALQYLGRCASYTTVTAFEVTPCVAWLDSNAVFTPALSEVAQVFELPLKHVLNPAHHEKRSVQTPAGERTFYAIPSTDTNGQSRFVWGATAGMLRNFYALMMDYQNKQL